MTTEAGSIETRDLNPTQELILEVLAARHRLGEPFWSFDTRNAHALQSLERRGLIATMSGSVPHTIRVGLTDNGREAILSDTYTPPVARCRHYDTAAELRRIADEIDPKGAGHEH